jgi:gas vesicle protein
MMASNNEKTNTILALTLGAAIGAAVALLLAPQSGKKTRRDIGRFGEKALDQTQAIRKELFNSIDRMANDVWDKVQHDFDRGRNWTEKSISDVQNVLDKGKKFIHAEIEKVRG